jgi:VIT1/CCC1 family predicted Fe2+/Mn2+ transporter
MTDSPGAVLQFWLIRILMSICACFFVLFGIFVLIASFFLTDPFMFIMSFLASTLIILISAAILAGLIVGMIKALRSGKETRGEGTGGGSGV